MSMVNYIAIIECDNEKFNAASAREYNHALLKLKASIEGRGSFRIYQVTDAEALAKFKAALEQVKR
jgi:hypothetical protein